MSGLQSELLRFTVWCNAEIEFAFLALSGRPFLNLLTSFARSSVPANSIPGLADVPSFPGHVDCAY